MQHVLLLRAPEEEDRDRYEVAFEERGYVPVSVPVLKTVLAHVDALRDKIVRGPAGLSGVILTSKRAVEAWCEALQAVADTTQVDWRTVPFYVVGAATAEAVSRIRTSLPPADVRGSDAGTAECLAAFILAEGRTGRMLYLTGDKNRETLPGMLASGGVVLDTLEVYRTAGSSTLRADLGAALAKADRWAWVVHFAPSAAALATPVLREMSGALKVAAIGPTTASFLRDSLGVHVDVVSPTPGPDALCNAVVAYDVT